MDVVNFDLATQFRLSWHADWRSLLGSCIAPAIAGAAALAAVLSRCEAFSSID